MTELYEKSIHTLELPAVLEMLAGEAVSGPAKDEAGRLRPGSGEYEIKRRLSQTTAAKNMMVLKGSPSFSGIKDVRSSLSRADMGGLLNTRELLDIAGVLGAARSVRSYAAGDGSFSGSIDFLFSSLMANKYLEERITTSIIGEDEIADSASAELSDIRRHIRASGARIRDTLQKIISSPAYAKVLQEPIITTRSERYVVPVKAEHKGALQGLVHDVSASGATLFIEPMAVVKENNEIRELRAKEKQEIERILAELSAECAAHCDDITRDFTVLVELDVIFAKAKLSYKLDGQEPVITEKALVFKKARHPLLPRGAAVPIDVELGGDFDTLVITGPNTGGKTVTLKTIGLLCLMAYCGLHIPAADGSSVPVYKTVLADIGDEQSIEQSLSTFSSHMTTIVKILEACDEDSLLLFDELGAGTDPVEGAALATAIIECARKRGGTIAATTHYAELKVYATTRDGVQNASCEFDVESLRPTYKLLIGIPGKSNAFAIGARLGLPEEIIEDARSRVNPENAGFEATIERLERQRQLLENDKEETQRLRREAEENAKKADFLRRELAVRLEKADEKARRDAERILADARQTAERAFDELDAMKKRMAKELDHARENAARAELRRSLNEAEEKLRADKKPFEEKRKISARPAEKGDTVEHRAMGVKARVADISADGVLILQAGAMKIKAAQDEVYVLEGREKPKEKQAASGFVSGIREPVRSELDLRGMMTDEAVAVLDRYIDSASMNKLEQVTIIHGKGTGALRAAVQQELKTHRAVKKYRLGRYGEGEDGVTIAELKQ